MQKFSSSYGGTKENFIVKTFSNNKCRIDVNIFALLCVVQNILQRGNPTKPSEFLKSKLGKLNADDIPIYLIDNSKLIWNNIKGDDQNCYYPAREFYNKTLTNFFGEYSFVKNLILPEAEFSDVLEDNNNFKNQQMDFYIPQLKMAFEIDGSSHEEESQKIKDRLRDKVLNDKGIEVIRIKTVDFENKTESFIEKLQHLKKLLLDSPLIDEYKQSLNISSNDIRIKYDTIMRLQMGILHCFKNNIININDEQFKIKIVKTDVDELDQLLIIAYEDLKLWISNIAQLAKIKICLPKLKISDANDKKSIALDCCMFRRYADGDEYFNSKVNKIYIRTDYFFDKEYYKISASKLIKYKFTVDSELRDDDSLRFLLKNLFGHDDFRSGQIPILEHILSRNDTIGILPTGMGKSLCYQLPALLQPGITPVVVPITSLMQDQKRVMEEKGINRVAYISGITSREEKNKIINEFKFGKYQFMVVTPERFQNAEFRESLGEINRIFKFSMAVIDEVHCLSEWGHDFRVSYLRLIPTIRKYCPQACLLGLTATASQAVLNDLKAEFENDGSGIKALSSMDREELIFKRIPIANNQERDSKILEVISQNEGEYEAGGIVKNSVGLIFCQTIKTENGCKKLQEKLSGSSKIHGDVETFYSELKTKVEAQERFMDKNFKGLMVCTTAFGMGIDKENIKYTIHNSLPKSIESFYQEAGRAGRDKIKEPKSNCYIIYKPEQVDSEIINKIFDKNTSILYRKELCGNLKNSDLSKIMYFLNLDKDSPEEECNKILQLLNELKNSDYDYNFKNIEFDNEAISLEYRLEALRRLEKLGAIKSWSIDYLKPNSGKVKVSNVGINMRIIKNVKDNNKIIQDTFTKLSNGLMNLEFKNNFLLQSRQLALYKLTLLGIVKDWTVEYYSLSSGRLNIDYVGTNIDDMKKSLLTYIRKHDAEFSLDGKLNNYKQYYDLLNAFPKDPIKALIMILITWTNNTILYNRLQSSKNMMDFCSQDITDEEFRQKINDFFKYTEKTVIFDAIVNDPQNYQNWLDILTIKGDDNQVYLIDKDKATGTFTSLLRYLESYGNNTGLNYLSGMLSLISGNFKGLNGEGRLLDSFRSIKESMPIDKQKKIIENTLHIMVNCSNNEKNMFSEALLKIYPEFTEHVYEVLQDFYSLSLIIDNRTLRIRKTLEENTNGLCKTA